MIQRSSMDSTIWGSIAEYQKIYQIYFKKKNLVGVGLYQITMIPRIQLCDITDTFVLVHSIFT